MWRVSFFDEHMEIVEMLDRLTLHKPSRWAAWYTKRHGYYTYAIGAMR